MLFIYGERPRFIWNDRQNSNVGNFTLRVLREQQERLTNSTELSPFWEAASCAATLEIPNIFAEPEVSLPCSKEPSTEQNQFIPYLPIISL
jgi:hypothetical protein